MNGVRYLDNNVRRYMLRNSAGELREVRICTWENHDGTWAANVEMPLWSTITDRYPTERWAILAGLEFVLDDFGIGQRIKRYRGQWFATGVGGQLDDRGFDEPLDARRARRHALSDDGTCGLPGHVGLDCTSCHVELLRSCEHCGDPSDARVVEPLVDERLGLLVEAMIDHANVFSCTEAEALVELFLIHGYTEAATAVLIEHARADCDESDHHLDWTDQQCIDRITELRSCLRLAGVTTC